jgi:predicted ATPase
MSLPDRAVPAPHPKQAASFLRRVVILDYKSIRHCDVELGPLTFLVGRNGSGKSNFLDALRFVADGLWASLDQAVRSRVSIYDIKRRGPGLSFWILLELRFPDQLIITYDLVMIAHSSGSFEVASEELQIDSASGEPLAYYAVKSGSVVRSSMENPPAAYADRLYLVSASGLPEFRPAYDALSSMVFYNFNPEAMRRFQTPDAGELLRRDGSNVASVIARLGNEQPQIMERITQYMGAIVPGLERIERVALGPAETLKFTQTTGELLFPHEFFLWSMSDGTLRALGSLVAAFQFAEGEKIPGLVGIEEPENSLHPAATAVLMDAFREAATRTQILITSHSTDMLDQLDLNSEMLLAVSSTEGVTKVAPIDQASLKIIKDQLYSAGELLRQDQLEPDPEDLARQEREARRSTSQGDEAD